MSTPKDPNQPHDSKAEDTPLTVSEFEHIAKTKLTKQVWDYYVSGADEQKAIKRNRKAFDRLILRPRVFRDVSKVDTSAVLFGKKFSFPVGVSPSAMQKLVGGDGELDVAKAVAQRGTFMILSSNSTSPLEEVIGATGSAPEDVNFWFQIYISQDRAKSAKLIQRAEAAGYTALAVTVDTPVLGNRLNERKTQLVLPSHLTLPNLDDPDPSRGAKPSLNRELLNASDRATAERIVALAARRGLLNDASLTWHETLPWLRAQTKMKIVVKGVMTAEDALLAVAHGADAIVVSNHGGRQLDGVSSTIEALPEVVAAVRGRVPVLVDGGITRGSDVFKALALGAGFCLVGRPALWGLAYGEGRRGVEMVLDVLERELSRTMALMGAATLSEIERGMLGVRRREGFGVVKL